MCAVQSKLTLRSAESAASISCLQVNQVSWRVCDEQRRGVVRVAERRGVVVSIQYGAVLVLEFEQGVVDRIARNVDERSAQIAKTHALLAPTAGELEIRLFDSFTQRRTPVRPDHVVGRVALTRIVEDW